MMISPLIMFVRDRIGDDIEEVLGDPLLLHVKIVAIIINHIYDLLLFYV